MYCPCGAETKDNEDYLSYYIYDNDGNGIGFVCIHGQVIYTDY